METSGRSSDVGTRRKQSGRKKDGKRRGEDGKRNGKGKPQEGHCFKIADRLDLTDVHTSFKVNQFLTGHGNMSTSL